MNDATVLAKAQRAARDAAAQPQELAQPTVSLMEWGSITNARLSALEEQMAARLSPLEIHLADLREMWSKVNHAVRIRLDRLDARFTAKAEKPTTYEIIYLPDSSGTGKGRFIVLGEPK